jgi:hypothetical protein
MPETCPTRARDIAETSPKHAQIQLATAIGVRNDEPVPTT